jgi:hypothetical protein
MKRCIQIACASLIIAHLCASGLQSHSRPFDGKDFKGRIAFSSDGNYNDEDDWGAFPVAVALLDAFGVTDKLVHVDYCNILAKNDPRFYREMSESVLGSAERYNIPRSILFDCQKNLDGAIESIKNAINASSADDPLYYVLAGPMEAPFRGIEKSDPEKRKYVYCISHSVWNDGYTRSDRDLHTHNKRDVIRSGINWIQCKDGNRNLAHSGGVGKRSTPQQWSLYHWLRDAGDPRLRWIFTRLEAEGRADISDATMTYFLLTGNEDANLAKLKNLLDAKKMPHIAKQRSNVRIEAENFRHLDGYKVEYSGRNVSHRLNVTLPSIRTGAIRTTFNNIYAVSGPYDVDIRYFANKDGRCQLGLYFNGIQKGTSWFASGDDEAWRTQTISDVPVKAGDEIAVEVCGDSGECGKLDYVQLNYRGEAFGTAGSAKSRFTATGGLDDPDALPGQIIVVGKNPGYLKFNGGGPVYLCGPDNPEDFLFRGKLNPDGTRSGPQMEIIETIGKSGANAFHFQMTRMRRCNIKDEGDDTHCPFIDHDPSKPLNEKVLDQWDTWLDALEERGIIVHLEFYNDATDVERMGWTLDENGNLHPNERRFLEGIVKRFKHHKNIIWGIEESCNKLPRARVAHFKKISQLIAETDDRNHPIVQSFVTAETHEGDMHPDGVMSGDFRDDPHIDIVTWLHVPPHGKDYEAQHRAYLKYAEIDNDRFIAMKNETEYHRVNRTTSRIQTWACVLTGMHALEAQHNPARRDRRDRVVDDGKVVAFMEQTDWHMMKPHDHLAAGSTKWVLANPGNSYIAYTYNYSEPMGLKSMTAGTYDLKWFDTVDGDTVMQTGVSVSAGDVIWNKPDSIGREVALYVKR